MSVCRTLCFTLLMGGSTSFSALPPPADLLAPEPGATPSHTVWRSGSDADASFFPLAVWLQDPREATRYRSAGINLFVGLWKGPTEEQLRWLTEAGMPVICEQNSIGLQHMDDPIIAGWMLGDEPDNAQSFTEAWGGDAERVTRAWPEYAGRTWGAYGPPVPPGEVVNAYDEMKRRDPSRPVLLNLGQGVAWDGWVGRGVRTGHAEDYPAYLRGSDIVSFDIYPAAHAHEMVHDALWFVARGVQRLRRWSDTRQVVWNCIETGAINQANRGPTPEQVRAEVWLSLIHGSRGLIYFVHQFKPQFNAHALLDNEEMLRMVTRINQTVTRLAPVLNSQPPVQQAQVRSSTAGTPIHTLLKYYQRATYLFAASLHTEPTEAVFTLPGLTGDSAVEVLGEGRTLESRDGRFSDSFEGYGVHLYRIGPSVTSKP